MDTVSVDNLHQFQEYNSEGPAHIEDISLTIETQDEPVETVIEAVTDQAPDEADKAQFSLLTLEYYQQYFNVDTFMVLQRILKSMIPKLAPSNYLRKDLSENPDLYGPFWISVTLIFSIAISGNTASYLHYASDDYHWHYNFQLVLYAATCIFLYVIVLPVVLWVLFKYSLKPMDSVELNNASYTPTLLSLICIYGYSLSLYIPVSIICLISISMMQWFLVILAALISGFVLIDVMRPALRNLQYSRFLILGILSAHLILSLGFVMYFFKTSKDSLVTTTITASPVTQKTFSQAAAKNQIMLNS